MKIALRCALASLIALSEIALTAPARAVEPDDGAFILAPEGPPFGDGAVPAPAWGNPVAASPVLSPPDVYPVTQIYVSDEIARDGALTRYRTVTASDAPGTYARFLDTVATGAPSAYDGRAFNGRGTLSDGRALAGTYYQNFVPPLHRLRPWAIGRRRRSRGPGADRQARGRRSTS